MSVYLHLYFNDLHLGCVCICIFICVWACICICRSGYFSGRLHTDEQWLARRVGQYAFGKRSSYPVFVFTFSWWSIFGILYFILCSDENAPNAKVPKHRAQLFLPHPFSRFSPRLALWVTGVLFGCLWSCHSFSALEKVSSCWKDSIQYCPPSLTLTLLPRLRRKRDSFSLQLQLFSFSVRHPPPQLYKRSCSVLQSIKQCEMKCSVCSRVSTSAPSSAVGTQLVTLFRLRASHRRTLDTSRQFLSPKKMAQIKHQRAARYSVPVRTVSTVS